MNDIKRRNIYTNISFMHSINAIFDGNSISAKLNFEYKGDPQGFLIIYDFH